MKLLFLDIDGVLNKPYIQERNSHGFLGICKEMGTRLVRIIQETQCRIILSSTWRMWPETKQDIVWALGEPYEKAYLDETPVLGDKWHSRCEEIAEWIKANENIMQEVGSNFVILDDDDSPKWVYSLDNIVNTSYKEGLTEEKMQEVIRKLNK